MNRKLWQYSLAALVVALVGGCAVDDPIIPPLDTLEVRAILPDTVETGNPVPCGVYILKNTGNHKLVFDWRINGSAFFCGETTQTLMVQGVSPPEEYVSREPGTYVVTLIARAEGVENVFDEDSRTLVVRRRPAYITYTGRIAGSADLYRVPTDGSGKVEQITATGGDKQDVAVSHDGKKIAFARNKASCGNLEVLVVANRDGSGEEEIDCALLKGVEAPRWSPDDKYIGMVNWYLPPEVSGKLLQARVSVVDMATREIRHVNTRTCLDYGQPVAGDSTCIDGVQSLALAFSDDGKSVFVSVWESSVDFNDHVVVARVDLESSAMTRLFTGPSNKSLDFISPDVYDARGGLVSLVVVPSRHTDFANRLAVMSATGGELRYLTPVQNGPAQPDFPSFCPNEQGVEAIFYVDWNRGREIRTVNLDGTGDRIFFTADRSVWWTSCERPK